MRISSHSFGKLVCKGKVYSSDLIIYPGKVDDLWWRDQSHLIAWKDIQEIITAEPEVLVVGTGQFGMMKVEEGLTEKLKAEGIELLVARTKEACELFNKYSKEGKRVIGAFHLTC